MLKGLGVQYPTQRHAGIGEEAAVAGSKVRVEAKSGKQCGPMWTAFQRSWQQSEAARPEGDTRPFVASFAPHGTSEILYVIRERDLKDVVWALAYEWGWT